MLAIILTILTINLYITYGLFRLVFMGSKKITPILVTSIISHLLIGVILASRSHNTMYVMAVLKDMGGKNANK